MQPLKNAKILIVDDEVGMRNMLAHEFTLQGYRVDTASDGIEALHKLEEQPFQLVLCDINMPRSGGLEILETIRKRDTDTEVIMMTGYATVENALGAMKKGAYDFVQKPFNMDELSALVEKSLEKSELRRTILELQETKRHLETTQMQLIQSEKLAGIGQLAAGVAHELNNPLSGVLGFTQLLLESAGLSLQQRKDLETVQRESQRCRAIIQNLLQFSRRKNPKKEPVDAIPLLQATLQLVKYDFSASGIEIVQDLPASLPPVFGDSQQLQHVFLNLFNNARQAMDGRLQGRLSIAAEQEGGKIRMHFRDTGPGIPSDIQGKVFDPFFTTKPPGMGTGLGLSICYGIVQQHDGTLSFKSVMGEGTDFALELPIHG